MGRRLPSKGRFALFPGRESLWQLPALLGALLVLVPLLLVFSSWSAPQWSVWQHLGETRLPTLLGNTGVLLVGVGSGVFLLGVSLAWLTAMCEFPGRKLLDWLLMLPLAIPAYILAFIALGTLDYAGPVQRFWRNLFGHDAWFPDIRSSVGVITVLVLVFYPYVYLLARTAFLNQGRATLDAARTLGATSWQAFFRVALPVARPAIAAGVALALMETLADFGAVSVFNYDTFTTAIYQAWFGLFNLVAAAQLASVLLLFVFMAMFMEKKQRRMYQAGNASRRTAYPLKGFWAWAAFTYCSLVVALAFLLPVSRLFGWVLKSGWSAVDSRFLLLLEHTLVLGAVAGLGVVVLALLVAYGQRQHSGRFSKMLVQIAGMGYALPGSILAVGVMMVFAWIGRHHGSHALITGTLWAMLTAYMIRFFVVGFCSIDSSLALIRPSIEEAARTLGASHRRILSAIYLPILTPGILTALLMVLVDVMKEMPATLLLRPFGWDTLAVRIYELTSEGEWQRAAMPALFLIAAGLIPVILLMRRSAENY
ncbi:MAG: iron ABC transporter permease [Pseudomonadales bacterium]|nr:iron ABC transporter permease [Pseudomonadales bacterium]